MSTQAVTGARAGLVSKLQASGRAGTAVSAAFLAVPRHLFLPQIDAVAAYKDMAIVTKSDASGLSVSSSTQPTMMAIMLEQLGLATGQRVLEIGTGTGYNAALIATIVGDARSVVTIDIEPDVVEAARASLAAAGFADVSVICGDGADGVPDLAPYDRIIVTAGVWDLAPRWLAQLGAGGKIVLPLSVRGIQLSAAFEHAPEPAFEPAGRCWVSRSACRCGFIRMTGSSAGPESVLPLGPHPGLHALVADGTAPEAGLLYAALSGPAVQVPAGLRVGSIAELADLDLWLALTEPGLTRINLMGRHEERTDEVRQRIAGLLPLGGYARHDGSGSLGVAALNVPGGVAMAPRENAEVVVEAYGDDGANLAAHLAERSAVWDGRGRPGAGTLELRAYPGRTQPEQIEGGIVIQRPNDVLVAGWPGTA
jgi:protein-L-isoaspartate(D-aspartate) O-methyltransferase